MTALWHSWQVRSKMRPAHLQRCPLQDSRPWRALGMPFWDLWRFYGIGLWEARWHSKPELGPILTPDGVEIPKGGNPRIYGEEIGYRFSVFIEACVKMELQGGTELQYLGIIARCIFLNQLASTPSFSSKSSSAIIMRMQHAKTTAATIPHAGQGLTFKDYSSCAIGNWTSDDGFKVSRIL